VFPHFGSRLRLLEARLAVDHVNDLTSILTLAMSRAVDSAAVSVSVVPDTGPLQRTCFRVASVGARLATSYAQAMARPRKSPRQPTTVTCA
jgi:hypothetical protein